MPIRHCLTKNEEYPFFIIFFLAKAIMAKRNEKYQIFQIFFLVMPK
jgi:hypothetical protein